MSTLGLQVGGNSTISIVNADTNATPNTVPLRDASGGLTNANVVATTNLQTQGAFQGQASIQTASFTAGNATDFFCNATSGAITATLPTASLFPNRVYRFWVTDASGNGITLTGVLGKSTSTTQYDMITVVSNGTNWYGK